jgi:O-antigen/teichoic acid export membrane protein
MTPAGRSIWPRYLLLVTANLTSKGSGFLVLILVVRHFGGEGLGAITFAGAVVAHAALVASAGVEIYAVKRMAERSGSPGALAGTIVALRLLSGLAVYALLCLLAASLPPLRAVSGLMALFGLSLFTTALSLAWVPEALQATTVLAAGELVTDAASVALLAGCLWLGGGLWAFPLARVAGEALTALGLFVWARRAVGPLGRPVPREWPGIITQAAPIGTARVLRSLALGTDPIVLAFFVPLEEVGWYGGAYKLFLLSVSLSAVYFVVLFPRLVGKVRTSPAALRDEVTGSLRRTLPVALPATAGAVLLAGEALRVLYGPPFAAAAPALRLLLLAALANLVGAHYRNVLLSTNRQRLDLALVAASAGGELVLKVLLIPPLGPAGVALGTLVGESALALATWQATRGLLGRRERRPAHA